MKGPVEVIEEQEPPSNEGNEFSEFMWMGEELEEFDRQVEEQFWHEQFWESYFEDMFGDSDVDEKMELLQMMDMLSFQDPQPNGSVQSLPQHGMQASNSNNSISHNQRSAPPTNSNSAAVSTVTSTLNPNAPEFVPRNVSPINAADR